MLFLVSSIALALTGGGWWMQRILFTPDATRDTAAAILAEPDIRQEINTIVAASTAPLIGMSGPDLGSFLETQVLSTRAGAAMMGPITEQAWDRIIGNRDDEPVVITGSDMIQIVRDETAAQAADVTLPIKPIGTLKTTRTSIGWMIIITAALGSITLLLGIAARPDRRDILQGLGGFGLAMAASMLVFGYLIPVHLLTAVDNSTWSHAMPRLAMRTLPVVLGTALIFGLGGAALLLASTSGGKRRQFSTPLSVARYRGGDNPGWG
jgi:hypothetical protein